jgi:CRP/FNR family transcriptional regulator, cyclic AMP receptor protein
MKQIWYFEEVDLFNILCPYKYADHIKHSPPFTYHKNDFLFLPNETSSEIFLITEGKIKVGNYDDDGNENIKIYLTRGELLGEMAFLGQMSHRDFAQATQEGTQVCKMSVEKARALARDYVPFSMEINKRIGENIRKLERRLEILFFKEIKRRLIELLKDLTAMYGESSPDQPNTYVNHSLTQQEMASLIATSRKSVSLMMNELEREGKLKQETGKFWILDPSIFD